MARGGLKRAAASKAGGVAKKCKTIQSAIHDADGVPKPVRSMLCNLLTRTFSTYKEDRHPFQRQVSDSVRDVLRASEKKLQANIREAAQKKSALEAAGAGPIGADDAAGKALEAATQAVAASKQALADGKVALADAKETAAKKASLEEFRTNQVAWIREGSPNVNVAGVGRKLANELGSANSTLSAEFLDCVVRTFSKRGGANWGTFDRIVDKKVDSELGAILDGLNRKLSAVTITAEKVTALEEAATNARAAEKEKDAAAKTAKGEAKQHRHQIQKAAEACTRAEGALTAFQQGALAAYTEAEANTKPPEPVPAPVAAPA